MGVLEWITETTCRLHFSNNHVISNLTLQGGKNLRHFFFPFLFLWFIFFYLYAVNSLLILSRYHPWAPVGHCTRYNPIIFQNEKKCFPYETIGNQGKCRNNSLSISWINDQVQYSKFQTASMLEVKF